MSNNTLLAYTRTLYQKETAIRAAVLFTATTTTMTVSSTVKCRCRCCRRNFYEAGGKGKTPGEALLGALAVYVSKHYDSCDDEYRRDGRRRHLHHVTAAEATTATRPNDQRCREMPFRIPGKIVADASYSFAHHFDVHPFLPNLSTEHRRLADDPAADGCHLLNKKGIMKGRSQSSVSLRLRSSYQALLRSGISSSLGQLASMQYFPSLSNASRVPSRVLPLLLLP